jgi:tetratricopeptide (TPR) repeat protein
MATSLGGIEAGRVAEIISGDRRGSGYRIGPTTVLTAAHVIADDPAPVVRFDADLPTEWSVTATSRWTNAKADLAVLTIPAPEHAPAVAVRFGRLGDRAAVVEAHAVGFPLFKLKNYDGTEITAEQLKDRYRDSHQAIGSIAVLSNRREQTLELTVIPPGPDPDPTVSPWQGMSGAALWVGDRIVGVIRAHHRSDGPGRLAGARLDRCLDGLDPADKAALRALVELPEHGGQLREVIPAEPAARVATAYREQVADIAPDDLLGRDDELGELVGFCAGDTPYAWWQAGPWAGKSALMSWLVLYPPAGVDVVSYFITGRYSGESDSAAFTAAMIEQLAALVGESSPGLLTGPGQRGQLLALLKTAAKHAQEAGRRLLVVVDGLDEDTSTRTDRESVASLLPRRPPPGVRVLVASRPHPPVPDDVPGDHPLRHLQPRPLDRSAYAHHLELEAKRELHELLSGSSLQQDVLGYITASGGGLTQPDLAHLTGRAPYELDGLLGGVFGRSVQSRGGHPGVHRSGERVYLFAHETLRTTAEQQFSGALSRYRDAIHRWAHSYRQHSWPQDTPAYLLRGYTRMLTSTNDLPRLTDCATDTARHDRMLQHTGGDHLALTEIAAAHDLNLRQPDINLEIALRLAVERDHLARRSTNIPTNMPAVWFLLGEATRAEALARAITDPDRQARALSALAQAVARAGEHDRAEDLARTITEPYQQVQTLSTLAQAAANTGEHDRARRLLAHAEDLARTITHPGRKAQTLSALAQAAANTGEHDRAEDLARTITDPDQQVQTLSELAQAAANTGDHDRAEDLARTITEPGQQAWALSELAQAAARAGEHDRARRLLAHAEDLARTITHPYQQVKTLSELAQAAARAGEHDRARRLLAHAEDLARTITEPYQQVQTLSELAQAAARAGEHDRAEDLARTITEPYQQAITLSALAQAAARAGEHDRAEDLAHTITEPYQQVQTLSTLAQAAANTGEHDRARRLLAHAEDLAPIITDPYQQAITLSALAQAAANTGEHDRAEHLAHTITQPDQQVQTLSELAQAAANTGEHDRARRLLAHAEDLARTITPGVQAMTLSALAQAAANTGQHDRAEDLARTITDPDQQVQTLSELAQAAANTGDHDRAEDLARTITHPDMRAQTLNTLAQELIHGSVEVAADTDLRKARRCVAEALASSSWAISVKTVAQLDPDAFRRAVNHPSTRKVLDPADKYR